MGKRTVKLAFMQDNTARKITYNKRVRGLIKKANELAVLCGIDVCALVYSVYDNAPVVYPSSEADVRRILTKFTRLSEMDQFQRKQNQEEFLKQRLTKASEKLKRLQVRNKEKEMENLISDLFTGKPVEQVPYNDLDNLVWMIEDRLRAVGHMIKKGEGHINAVDPVINPSENGNVMTVSGTVPFEMPAGPWYQSHQPAPSLGTDPSHLAGPSHLAAPFHQADPSQLGGLWYPSDQSAPTLEATPSHPAGPSIAGGVWYPSHQSTQSLQIGLPHPAGPHQNGLSNTGGLLYPSHQSAPSFQADPSHSAVPSQSSHQAGQSHSGGVWYPSHQSDPSVQAGLSRLADPSHQAGPSHSGGLVSASPVSPIFAGWLPSPGWSFSPE